MTAMANNKTDAGLMASIVLSALPARRRLIRVVSS